MACCNGIGMWTGAGVEPESPPPPVERPVFDFAEGASGGSHEGSFALERTRPKGWLGKGTFLPLTRSEKSLVESLSRASGGPNRRSEERRVGEEGRSRWA